jgi:hypothetical protein
MGEFHSWINIFIGILAQEKASLPDKNK